MTSLWAANGAVACPCGDPCSALHSGIWILTSQSISRPIPTEPTTRTRRPDDRAPEIARAALELFVTKGFAATKLEDVAKAAGVSKGLPYLYFKNKEELFKAVIVEAIGEPLVRANELVDAFEGTDRGAAARAGRQVPRVCREPAGRRHQADPGRGRQLPRRGALLLLQLRSARPRAVRQDAAPRRGARRVPRRSPTST